MELVILPSLYGICGIKLAYVFMILRPVLVQSKGSSFSSKPIISDAYVKKDETLCVV